MHRVFGMPVGGLSVALILLVGAGIGLIAALALRNRVFFRMALRNMTRRPGRSVMIVVGLTLATTIIAAALGTGDTMNRAVRADVFKTLGRSDEWVTVMGTKPDIDGATAGTAANVQLFDQHSVAAVDRKARESGLLNGVMPAIVRTVAAQDRTSRQTEPRVTLFAPEPSRMHGFGMIRARSGDPVELQTLPPGWVFLNRAAADALGAHQGDNIAVLAGTHVFSLRVADIVTYDGAGTARSALLVPLADAQQAIGAPNMIDTILLANRHGVGQTDSVVRALRPTLDSIGLEAQPMKQDGLKAADKAGDTFMSMFTTFGSFSIAAGILLIFLIFVMLAAERRTEMGVARAIGTQRGHLVQTFLFEGSAYDFVAAAIGALIGIAVSLAMVAGISRAFATESFTIAYTFRWQSVLIAYGLGVVLTFVVVAFSAWRVSVLNIVSAVRNLSEPTRRAGSHRGVIGGFVLVSMGVLISMSGRNAAQVMPFLLGLSLAAVGCVPLLRAMHVPDRVSYTVAGLTISALWLLPFRIIEPLVPGAKMDFTMWVVGGLLVVLGAVWVTIYNADALLGGTSALLGRVRSLSAVLRISMAYPLRNRLRTGMTLAMFTLVVFTLVVGITTPSSFINSSSKVDKFGGGFDVRALTSPASPVGDMAAALRTHPALAGEVRDVGALSTVLVKARQVNASKFVDYPVHGVDAGFLQNNRYALGSRARGYTSDAQVWDAIGKAGNLAVVDPWIVPHRRNWSFGALTDMSLTGFYAEDPTFDPVVVDVRDPDTGRVTPFTVIGVFRDSMPVEMAGITTSQKALASYGTRALPTTFLIALAPGAKADRFATALESAFLANGMQADSFAKLVHDSVAGANVFLRLIEGFMGLGLVVGVAALGVIAARSVVERRQQIGVLRAIGFQASTVRLGFLLESAFLALTSIVLGSALGLALAYNVVDDARRQATWPGIQLTIPWLNLGVVFLIVMLVALGTTYLPARRASRVYPAEALRYQ